MKRTRNERLERRRELRAMSGVLAVVLLICVNFMAMVQAMESAAW